MINMKNENRELGHDGESTAFEQDDGERRERSSYKYVVILWLLTSTMVSCAVACSAIGHVVVRLVGRMLGN